jgi:hypothetical protein
MEPHSGEDNSAKAHQHPDVARDGGSRHAAIDHRAAAADPTPRPVHHAAPTSPSARREGQPPPPLDTTVELDDLDASITLERDALDAPAPASVAEAQKSAAGHSSHDGGGR